MRIAELCTRFPPGLGGVERHVDELSRRLAAAGDDVRVYTTDLLREFPWERLGPEVPREETRAGVRIRRLRTWSLPGELHYPFFRGLGRSLARDRPELLHVHTYGTNQAAVAHRHFRRTRTPYVLTAHFHPIWSIEGGWLRHRIRGFYDRRLASSILEGAARIIVQSAEEERLLRALSVPLAPILRIPPGRTPLPDPPGPPDAFRRAYSVPGEFLLFVGRLASNKGLGTLLTAFGALARKDPTATLVLVGADGGQRPAVEAKASELGLSGRLRITGRISDERMLAAAFREARIFVLPSDYEAFGLVLLEALAQGTAVVASRVGGIPEMLDDGRAGALVPPGDPVALASAILDLWNDPARRSQSIEYARAHVLPRYRWESVVAQIRDRFRGILGS